MGYWKRSEARRKARLAAALPLPGKAAALGAVLAALGTWFLLGCSFSQPQAFRQSVSCSQTRLDGAQRLLQAARANMAQYYEQRGAASLNTAFYFANDAIVVARATRNCRDFDRDVRTVALNLIQQSGQMRSLAFSTMRDPDEQVIVTLLQDRYSEAFRGRDIE
ncbi:MAG: hypothetical protein ACHQZQ_05715 [SAR324 cluster bacterium]